MNVVDSSAWLEYFADGPNAPSFAPIITDLDHLIVPVISIYEVFKRVLQQRSETAALQAVAVMNQGQVIDLNQTLALSAAKLSADLKLPMADSLILATARAYGATLWTQDADFKSVTDVQYIAKK
ncbi:MAG TPA: type II toxin-antitoxin system VapC family toxin [Roseiflexaceae bacterium]|nr:type II toxin-antitoxin system VapC family toxin [Roseiflexaceae bacterium]